MVTHDADNGGGGSGADLEVRSRDSAANRVLALDVGDRRVGVAISDPLGYTAQPLVTIHRKNLREDVRSVARLLRKHGVATVVIGWPVHESGEVGRQALRTQSFAEELRSRCAGVGVHLLDERLTTKEAHEVLDGSGRTPRNKVERRERAAVIDQVAAVLLLEAYLSREAMQAAAAEAAE